MTKLYLPVLNNMMMEEQPIEHPQTESKSKMKLWLKRIGFWGFMFFLVKGLIWVAVFAGLIKAC